MELPAVVTLLATGLLVGIFAEPRDRFVFRLLSVYGGGPDQATAADRDNDDKISETEFLQSLFFFTDDKRDRQVSQAEFVDGYRRQFGLPSELLVIMFDLLDDLNDDGGTRQEEDMRDNRNNRFFDMFSKFTPGEGLFSSSKTQHGDGILTQRDVTVRQFVGDKEEPNKEEYRKSLMKWVAAAADRLYTINYQPHIPGDPWDLEFDYERWFHSVDRNNDSLVSFQELKEEFRRYSPDGSVMRSRWVERNLDYYGDREWLANVVFDYWDKNSDLRLDDNDIALILTEADRNRNMQVTSIEFHRFMEKYNKRARRRLATPVRPVMFDCPNPWWQASGCRPRVDATRAAMDMDDNFDGWITQGELRKRVSYYDRNGDGWASRMEVMMLESMRYGVNGPVANIMFDVYDRNGDGRYDNDDVQFMLTGGRVLCFCDARRAVLDLVRLSEKFKDSPQAQGPVGSLRNAMRWHLYTELQWQQQAEQLWQRIWDQGGSPGESCREGDCTGKDWRGGSWYSPFDWRQRNRVPENFLQWSYLRDIPRTVYYPQTFISGIGQFLPGARRNWWSPQFFSGGLFYGDGNRSPGSSADDGMRGGGFNFPPQGAENNPDSGRFPFGSTGFEAMPQDFMPNPSNRPAGPVSFPRTSSSPPFTKSGVPMTVGDQDESRNIAEEFWNLLMAGLDNQTLADWNPAVADYWERIFRNARSFPAMTQAGDGNGRSSKPFNRKPGAPSLTELLRKEAGGMKKESNVQITVAEELNEDLTTENHKDLLKAIDQGMSNAKTGTRLPRLASSRFRRYASSHENSPSRTGSLVLPAPSPSSKTDTSVKLFGKNATNSADSTTDQANNSTDSTGNTTRSTTDSTSTHGDETDVTKEDDEGKVARASAHFRNLLLGRNWPNHIQDHTGCDGADPLRQLSDVSDPAAYWSNINSLAGDQQSWQPLGDQHWLGAQSYNWNPPSANPPFIDKSFPNQWWSESYWQRYIPQYNSVGYLPVEGRKHFSFIHPGVVKRDTQQQTPNSEVPGVGRWLNTGSYFRLPLTPVASRTSDYPQWWNNWNSFEPSPPWESGDWNKMWRNDDNQGFFFPDVLGSPAVSSPFSLQGFPYRLGAQHAVSKRSTATKKETDHRVNTDKVAQFTSREFYGPLSHRYLNDFRTFNTMNRFGKPFDGYDYWPQWWNSRSAFVTLPMWGNFGDQPFLFPRDSVYNPHDRPNGPPLDAYHAVFKRSIEKTDKTAGDLMTRRMGGYWPQWWNVWPSWRNYDWTWNDFHYPFYFAKDENNEKTADKEHLISKRSTEAEKEKVSRMNSHYGGYWPQWNTWNKYRSNSNWMWNEFHYPYYFAQEENDAKTASKEHLISKRSTETTGEKVLRMNGQYGGYWPQWNSWNNYRYWPWWSNSNWMWNDFHYPYYFAQEGNDAKTASKEHLISKRSTETTGEKVLRMNGQYGGYWPQWNSWDNYRYWPWWSNSNWMWNDFYYPFYFAKDENGAKSVDKEHMISKRSTEESGENASIMNGPSGYWPQTKGYRNHHWMQYNFNIPSLFSVENVQTDKNDKEQLSVKEYPPKRSIRDVSGMTGDFRPYWRHSWNRNSINRPFFLTKDGPKKQSMNKERISKRSVEGTNTPIASRKGSYGYSDSQWNIWNSYRYWPERNRNTNWMWNDRNWDPNYFAKTDPKSDNPPANVHIINERSAQLPPEKHLASQMMRNEWTTDVAAGQWNMWNNKRYWPQWMWNFYTRAFPYYVKEADVSSANREHILAKRNAQENRGTFSSLMDNSGGYWPGQWMNRNRYQWNNMPWNHPGYYHPFLYSQTIDQKHIRSKRQTDQKLNYGELSRMMGGFNPRQWDTYTHWPRWNHYPWGWNNDFFRYYPFMLAKGDSSTTNPSFRWKRNANVEKDSEPSRMMDGYGPRWWNLMNRYRFWPEWDSYRNFPFGFTQTLDPPVSGNMRSKKRAVEVTRREEVSRIVHDYGIYRPSWWNMLTGFWPGHWNWMTHHNYPFQFSKNGNQETEGEKKHLSKRSADDPVSKMVDGYDSYSPHGWNILHHHFYLSKEDDQGQHEEHLISKRSADELNKGGISTMMEDLDWYTPHWPDQWHTWNWNDYNWISNSFFPFYHAKDERGKTSDKEHILSKRSTVQQYPNQVSRMMNAYGSYFPQWWNMWNRNYWNYWNNNDWMRNNFYYPLYFAKSGDQEMSNEKNRVRSKRSLNSQNTETSGRKLAAFTNYQPQWWNSWYPYRHWPPNSWNSWNWNSNNWMSNTYLPFSFAKSNHKDGIVKRSADLSRMMDPYSGYWPQGWNNFGYRPSYENRWNWRDDYYSYYFNKDGTSEPVQKEHSISKRGVDDPKSEQLSRMINGYGGYSPYWWNMWNTRWYLPAYWNNWNSDRYNWMNNGYSPFYFAKGEKQQTDKQHLLSKRSTSGQNTGQISSMMNSYTRNWPQWWNNNNNIWNQWNYRNNNWMWNSFFSPYYFAKGSSKDQTTDSEQLRSKRSIPMSPTFDGYNDRWPRYWNNWNWNNYNRMWNSYYPFYFAKEGEQEKPHTVSKRSVENQDEKEVSKMMGAYQRFWPHWNAWMWYYNRYYNPFYFSRKSPSPVNQPVRAKRSFYENAENKEFSQMMGANYDFFPSWWNSYGNWPGNWNNYHRIWNNYYPFYFAQGEQPPQKLKDHIVSKRSTDGQKKDYVSRMASFGGLWPERWNSNMYWPQWASDFNYWPQWRSNWPRWNGFPFSFTSLQQQDAESREHRVTKRRADGETSVDDTKGANKVAKMMGDYSVTAWPQWWNLWNSNSYSPDPWHGGRNNWMWPQYHPQQTTVWDNYEWMSANFPYYKQAAIQDHPAVFSSPQQTLWNLGPRMQGPNLFAYSKDGETENQDATHKQQRQKRNADLKEETSTIQPNSTHVAGALTLSNSSNDPENSTKYTGDITQSTLAKVLKNTTAFSSTEITENNINSTSTTQAANEFASSAIAEGLEVSKTTATAEVTSRSPPGIARQMSGYAGIPGNIYQQQWWRLFRSYLNSRPRYSSDEPFRTQKWGCYGNLCGRYFIVRYNLPWPVFQLWYRFMMLNNAGRWNWLGNNCYYHPWYLLAHYFPSALQTRPDIRQQTAETKPSGVTREQNEDDDTGIESNQRSRRSIGSMHSYNLYPFYLGAGYEFGRFPNMYPDYGENKEDGFYSWPRYGANGIYNNNYYWPWWDGYNRMRNNWNGNNYPFMYSHKEKIDQEKMKHHTAMEVDSDEHSQNDDSRYKRSALFNTKGDQAVDPKVKTWLGVSQPDFTQRGRPENVWNNLLAVWQGGYPWNEGQGHMFSGFQSVPHDGFVWNGYLQPSLGMNTLGRDWNFDQSREWTNARTFYPFSFSSEVRNSEKKPATERLHKRSIAETTDGEPKTAQWMQGWEPRGYSWTPSMSMPMQPWPAALGHNWQLQQYNSQQGWQSFDSWGRRAWNDRISGYSEAFPSYPLAFATADDSKTQQTRKKRSDSAEEHEVKDKDGTADKAKGEPDVSRMGVRLNPMRKYPMGSDSYRSDFFNNRQWTRYRWPMIESYNYWPWWSDRYYWNQYQYRPSWNHYGFSPSENPYLGDSVQGWSTDGHQNTGDSYFNNRLVDENLFDPLSSFYFSQKDTSNDKTEEKTEENEAQQIVPTNRKINTSQEKSRSKRSLAEILYRGRDQDRTVKNYHENVRQVHDNFKKRGALKMKQFSPEVKARLENRFRKRSVSAAPASPPNTAQPEVATKFPGRATVPGPGQSTANREFMPPTNSEYSQHPNFSPQTQDHDRSPYQNPGTRPGSGQTRNPFGNVDGADSFNQNQPGGESYQNWFGSHVPGDTGSGQDLGSVGQGNAGNQDSNDGDSESGSSDGQGQNIVNGDLDSRLGNYNYIDQNNQNFWNQFYNPPFRNTSAAGLLGNSTQWNDWFSLWAYGPNFWEGDSDDMDLWAPPWDQDPVSVGPGGNQWGSNWNTEPSGFWWPGHPMGFNSAPTEIGFEGFWVDDCSDVGYRDWDSFDYGYRPWNPDTWWDAGWSVVDVVYFEFDPFEDIPDYARGLGRCFRPYSLSFESPQRFFPLKYNFFRPHSLSQLPLSQSFQPSGYHTGPFSAMFRKPPPDFGSAFNAFLDGFYGKRGLPGLGSNQWGHVDQGSRFPPYRNPWDFNGRVVDLETAGGQDSRGGDGTQTASGTLGAIESSTAATWTARSAGVSVPWLQQSTGKPRPQRSTTWVYRPTWLTSVPWIGGPWQRSTSGRLHQLSTTLERLQQPTTTIKASSTALDWPRPFTTPDLWHQHDPRVVTTRVPTSTLGRAGPPTTTATTTAGPLTSIQGPRVGPTGWGVRPTSSLGGIKTIGTWRMQPTTSASTTSFPDFRTTWGIRAASSPDILSTGSLPASMGSGDIRFSWGPQAPVTWAPTSRATQALGGSSFHEWERTSSDHRVEDSTEDPCAKQVQHLLELLKSQSSGKEGGSPSSR